MSAKIGLGLHWANQGVIYKELVGIDGKKRINGRLIYRVVESLEVQFLPLLCFTMCCCGYLRVLRRTLICLSNSGQEGERTQPGPACRTVRRIIMQSTVECFVLGAVQTGRLASHQCLPLPVSHACRPLWLALPLFTPTPPPSPLTLTSAASLVGG